MVSAVGNRTVAALQGQVRQVRSQLDDWTTCVSAKTTKGQAAIQKLSGELSAVQGQIARVLQTDSGSGSGQLTPAAPGQSDRSTTRTHPGSIDVWA
jgi:hypothetical protein